MFRSGLVRNLGNITTPRLFNRAYAGTKLLIEDYVTHVAIAIRQIASHPTSQWCDAGLSSQAKLDLLHDARQSFGRSALVLQGGSAMSAFCHLGVAKALHLRGLLPRIVAGSSTGAIVAAFVCACTEEELLPFLSGDSIDLNAILLHCHEDAKTPAMLRLLRNYLKDGKSFDSRKLEGCLRAEIGDLTFEEAYFRSERVLNIILSTKQDAEAPRLLNYLTTPKTVSYGSRGLVIAN